MTDKTIINGVDVSGCFHLYPTRECDLNGHYPGFPKYCHEDPACYYKQSARKDERIMELEEEKTEKRKQCDACLKEWTCEAYKFLKRQNSGYRTSTEKQRKLIKELKQLLILADF